MRRTHRNTATTCGVLVLSALALTGCGNGADTPGRIDLELAGGTPGGNIHEAWLEFSGLTVERTDGTRVQHGFDKPRRIDLARLTQGNATTLIEDMELPAGRYEWIHLHLNTRGREDTYLLLADGSVRELVVPSEERNHLRIETPFDVPPDGEVQRTIGFHLHEPLREKGPTSNTYALRPILRSVDTTTATHIKATADRDFVARHCDEPHRSGLALYVYAGEDITPDDVGGSGAEPISISARHAENADQPFGFHASFLGPGAYTIALTCNAGGDGANTDDRFVFFATAGIRTEAGDTVDHRFGGPERP